LDGKAGSLLTAPGVEIGDGGVRLRVFSRLLFPEDDAVFHIEVEAAVSLIPAVEDVGTFDNFVPSPSLPIDVLDSSVAGRFVAQRIARVFDLKCPGIHVVIPSTGR
jgi:hypothetical protein